MATIGIPEGDGSKAAAGLDISTAPLADMSSMGSEETKEVNGVSPAQIEGPQSQDGKKAKVVRPKKGTGERAVAEESGSSSDSDQYIGDADNGEWWRDYQIDRASGLDSAGLYEAYLRRLGREDRPSNKVNQGSGDSHNTRVNSTGDTQQRGQRRKKVKGSAMIRSVLDYTRMLEDRIGKLETAESARLAREKQGTSEDTVVEAQPAVAGGEKQAGKGDDLLLEAKFYSAEGEFSPDGEWKDNASKKGSYQCNTEPNYLIRVLHTWQGGIPSLTPIGATPDPDEIEMLGLGIMSEPIAAFFAARLNLTAAGPLGRLIRMGKPFLPLIRNLEPLRAQLAKLEERYGSDDATLRDTAQQAQQPPEGSASDGGDLPSQLADPLPFATLSAEGADKEDKFESREALSHFRFLLGFVDKYLGRQLELLQRLRLGQEETIAFQNLWMLFDAGDAISCPLQEGGVTLGFGDDSHTTKRRYLPQVFRVLGTTGGLPLRKTLGPRGNIGDDYDDGDGMWGTLLQVVSGSFMGQGGHRTGQAAGTGIRIANAVPASRRARDRFTPLHVVCFHVDFDGTKYGTIREIFTFKPYDGVVDIRSLEAYPTQYLRPEPDQATTEPDVERFVNRGRRFIDVTAVSHLSYESLTVGRSREEINSAVIVDFKLAFQEYRDSFVGGENVVPKLTSLAGYWPNTFSNEVLQLYSTSCSTLWCHDKDCLSDCYSSFHSDQVQKAEPKVKALLEEHDSGNLDNRGSLERFKAYMEEKDLIRLLPGVVPGFALRNRKWVQLDLEQLKKLEQGDDWHKLVLPRGHREMVQAMVETHTRGSQETRWDGSSSSGKVVMDLVQGKGRGCIILLHGVPGVGKTSTAECVASYTKRPLYPITCGDIGYVPEAVEENMEGHFKLAHKWGCVLLLDEADVFLAKRSKGDVKRNGLVSVFLRILEYYSGILFLTTNRVGAIDDAFRSRLHLTLYYPKLTGKQTIKIWKNNLDRLKDINQTRGDTDQSPIEFDRKKILKWVDRNWNTLQWNGRQIRNAFQTAVALAQFTAKIEAEDARRRSSAKKTKDNRSRSRSPRPPVMAVHHFKLIADASMQFSEYLQETHGVDEDLMAHRDEIRAISFEPKAKRKELEEVESSTTESDSDDSSEAETEVSRESEDGQSSRDSEKSDSEEDVGKKKTKGKKRKDEGGGSQSKAKVAQGSKKGKDGEKAKGKDKKKKDK